MKKALFACAWPNNEEASRIPFGVQSELRFFCTIQFIVSGGNGMLELSGRFLACNSLFDSIIINKHFSSPSCLLSLAIRRLFGKKINPRNRFGPVRLKKGCAKSKPKSKPRPWP
jgi:hypothetical protein